MAAAVLLAFGAPGAAASSAPDAGQAFEPPPLPVARFGVQPPKVDPLRQIRRVAAADGVSLYTETWLPAAKNGSVPPGRLPVVLIYTIYATPGAPDADQAWAIPLLVPRGYAVTFAHVRGFGGSGGCYEYLGPSEVGDGARLVEDAGTRAPWASGTVGMLGFSNPGGTQILTATGPDRTRLASLKALVVGAPPTSLYDVYHHDGVPHMMQSTVVTVTDPLYRTGRPRCPSPTTPGMEDGVSGNFAPFYAERDYSRRLERLTTPLLMFHGHVDRTVGAHAQIGVFDALPPGTPRAGLFGVWDHEYPDSYGSQPDSPRKDWERADFQRMVYAWYEHWLRGEDAGVGRWPVAQVQGTDGQWRTASTWPRVPGAPGQLLLGPSGALGATDPSGTSAFLEAPTFEMEVEGTSTEAPGTAAVFTTPPLAQRLELVGTPEVDLWVQLTVPDAHLTVHLEALDAAGNRVTRESRTVGARSAMHLNPIENGRFRQPESRPAPVAAPVRVTVRLNPTDLAVPAGGRLRLAVTGSSIAWDGAEAIDTEAGMPDGSLAPVDTAFQGPFLPSGLVQPIVILHDCEHRSALRFTMPEPASALLNVREKDEGTAPLADNSAAPAPATDGGGVATAPACAG